MRVWVAIGSTLLVAGHTTALTYIYCLPCQPQLCATLCALQLSLTQQCPNHLTTNKE